MTEPNDAKWSRTIYLLPNFLTTAALFAGFYAVVAAMKGFFDIAMFSILIAMVVDSLDGRIARLMGAESSFGAQYDSLSDMLAFGLAPALVAYAWCLSSLGKLGWLAAFCYTAAAALRLARFNVNAKQTEEEMLRYFQGLPSPAAAGFIAGTVWFCQDQGFSGTAIASLVAALTVLMGALMVSNIRYYSFKHIDLKGKVHFKVLLLIVMGYVFVSLDPLRVLFGACVLYVFSGVMSACWNYRHDRRKANKATS